MNWEIFLTVLVAFAGTLLLVGLMGWLYEMLDGLGLLIGALLACLAAATILGLVVQ